MTCVLYVVPVQRNNFRHVGSRAAPEPQRIPFRGFPKFSLFRYKDLNFTLIVRLVLTFHEVLFRKLVDMRSSVMKK